jgi:hypothetical protein
MEVCLPMLNMRYMLYLSKLGFEPKVFYDIGCSDKKWSVVLPHIFKGLRCITIDADAKFNADFPVCLSNVDNKEVLFYKYDKDVNSYYPIIGYPNDNFDVLHTIKLDSLIKEQDLPKPDFIKINCCGTDKDIIEGGLEAIKNCKYIIVTLNNTPVFKDAPIASEIGDYIKSLGFDVKGALDNNGLGLIDYVFVNKNI